MSLWGNCHSYYHIKLPGQHILVAMCCDLNESGLQRPTRKGTVRCDLLRVAVTFLEEAYKLGSALGFKSSTQLLKLKTDPN